MLVAVVVDGVQSISVRYMPTKNIPKPRPSYLTINKAGLPRKVGRSADFVARKLSQLLNARR